MPPRLESVGKTTIYKHRSVVAARLGIPLSLMPTPVGFLEPDATTETPAGSRATFANPTGTLPPQKQGSSSRDTGPSEPREDAGPSQPRGGAGPSEERRGAGPSQLRWGWGNDKTASILRHWGNTELSNPQTRKKHHPNFVVTMHRAVRAVNQHPKVISNYDEAIVISGVGDYIANRIEELQIRHMHEFGEGPSGREEVIDLDSEDDAICNQSDKSNTVQRSAGTSSSPLDSPFLLQLCELAGVTMQCALSITGNCFASTEELRLRYRTDPDGTRVQLESVLFAEQADVGWSESTSRSILNFF